MPTPFTLRRHSLAVLAIIVAGSGCRRHELAAGVTDSSFVTVMAALRRLPATALVDSASRMRARDSILRHFGTSATALERAAEALVRDPERANQLWRAVERKQSEPQRPPAAKTGAAPQ